MSECTFIIFGITGDLSKRMLLPALYKLLADKKLDNFAIIGAALSESSVDEILERAKPFVHEYDETLWRSLRDRMTYHQMDITQEKEFCKLKEIIESIERKYTLQGNRLIHCATASDFFCDITRNVGVAHIMERTTGNPWHRIIYEKPFGHDTQSAQAINECIKKYINEEQVFRIDHYLTKEVVSNIALLRFTNIIFEPLWNKNYIDQVHITLSETLGLEGRGRYYDTYGVLDDVVQNHALQLLALIAMEPPTQLSGTYIQERKAEVLHKVIPEDGILGQYEGYRHEKDVAPYSTTPTCAVIRLQVDTPRWEGVPFYIKAGKELDIKKTTITLKFKEIYCPLKEGEDCPCNYLNMEVAPHPSFSLALNIKPVGVHEQVHPITMNFSYKNFFGPRTPAAYELLLEFVMQGEQAISVSSNEIMYAWNIIEKIKKMNVPLYPYRKKSNGPIELEHFFKKYRVR